MRLSDFCNRLTTTCTQHGPSDSRARLGSPRMSLAGSSLGLPCGRASATPRGVASAAGAGLPSVLGPPASPRVERRLTATLQLPPSSTTMPGACPGPRPRARVEAGTARSWWSCDRQLLRAVRRAAALSAANQARDVASDALCRSPPPRPAFPREERTAPTVPPGPPSPPSRQRQRLPPDQGAFRRRDLPPLGLQHACAVRRPSPHGEPCPSGRHCCRLYPWARGRMHATALHGPRDVPAFRCACARRDAWPPQEGHDASSPLCARQKPLC